MRRTLLHRSLVVLLLAVLCPVVTSAPADAGTVCQPGDVLWDGGSETDPQDLSLAENWENDVLPEGVDACASQAEGEYAVSAGGTLNVLDLRLADSINVAGTLGLDGDATIGFSSSAVGIEAGGTLRARGTIDTEVFNSDGTVQPGAPLGALTALSYSQSQGVLDLEIGGPDPGTGHDQLISQDDALFYDASVGVALWTASCPPMGRPST